MPRSGLRDFYDLALVAAGTLPHNLNNGLHGITRRLGVGTSQAMKPFCLTNSGPKLFSGANRPLKFRSQRGWRFSRCAQFCAFTRAAAKELGDARRYVLE